MNLQRSDFDYWSAINTRWRDMDALGHLNHAIYLEYMETARVDVYIQLGFSGIRKDMDESTILGSMDVHYLSQVKHPSSLDVGHRICRVGSKSFDFWQQFLKRMKKNRFVQHYSKWWHLIMIQIRRSLFLTLFVKIVALLNESTVFFSS